MTRKMRTVPDRGAWRQWFEGIRITERQCRKCERVPTGLIQFSAWVDSAGPRFVDVLCPQHRREIVPPGVVDEKLDVIVVSGRLGEDRCLHGVSVDYLSPPVESAPARTDAGRR
jgi:hypothetical protein